MKYINCKQIFEAISEFEYDVSDWNDQKKFLDPVEVKKIDDFLIEITKTFKIMNSCKRASLDKKQYTKKFKSDYLKLKTLIRKAKSNIPIKFKVGQILEISKMNRFSYNTAHDTLRAENDRCIDAEELGLGRFSVYSDIEIIEISDNNKSIVIKFNGIDYGPIGSYRFSRSNIKLKLTMDKFKIFYFNLMNDGEYKSVMNGNYMKQINENWELDFPINWELKKKFLDRDMINDLETAVKEVNDLEDKIEEYKKVMNDKKSKSRSLLNNILKSSKVGFKKGNVLYMEELKHFRPRYSENICSLYSNILRASIYSNIKIVDVNPKSVTVEMKYLLESEEYGKNKIPNIENIKNEIRRKTFSISTFNKFYLDLVTSDDYMKVMSGKYMKQINEGNKSIFDLKVSKSQLYKKIRIYKDFLDNMDIKKMNENDNNNNRYNRNIQSDMDDILDKISDSGLDSLSSEEKSFMKSFKNGREKESYEKLNKKVYKDDIFEFELDRVEHSGIDRKVFYGTLKIDGKTFDGYITQMSNGMNDPQFNDKNGFTLWDHADGFEYELDDFIDSIVMDN